MKQEFFNLAESLYTKLEGEEVLLCSFEGEKSDFVRFNHGKVRQAGNVSDAVLSLTLAVESKMVSGSYNLSFDPELDFADGVDIISSLRKTLESAPVDPYFDFNKDVISSDVVHESMMPGSGEMVEQIAALSNGLDLVGILATGHIFKGFASSLGHNNFVESANFNFDFACYLEVDKAVKSGYAGSKWSSEDLREKFKEIKSQLELLGRNSKRIEPGKYRVYLSPAALDEIVTMLNWGGFSKKGIETKSSTLNHLFTGAKSFSEKVNFVQATSRGYGANFDGFGNMLPDEVSLVEAGKFKNALCSSRSAKEYKAKLNIDSEVAWAFEMEAGTVAHSDILKELGTGLFISNLWYLNYSDRASGRITGMTRFATFWVENGEIKYPVEVMRFDDSLFNIFGENLECLTKEREYILDPGTYYRRSTDSKLLPGAIVRDFEFTL